MGDIRLLFILLILVPYASYGAEIVAFGGKLCPPGQHFMSGACRTIDRTDCPSGYYNYGIDTGTFSAPLNGQCRGVYDEFTIDDTKYRVTYSQGLLVNFGATLCPAGKIMSSGTCVDKASSKCTSGYYNVGVDGSTFTSPNQDQQCFGVYDEYDLIEPYYLIYSGGMLVNFAAAPLCPSGYYQSAGECIPYEQGDCPENMLDLNLDSDALMRRNVGNCETGYSPFGITASCDAAERQDNMCILMCPSGTTYTNVGTCAPRCPVMKSVHFDNVELPLYATRETDPSLNFQLLAGEICYVNMLPGLQVGTLNTEINGTVYHMTD